MSTEKKSQKPQGRPTPPGPNMGENATETSTRKTAENSAPTSRDEKQGSAKAASK